MKTKLLPIWIVLITLAGFGLILISSCKKDEDVDIIQTITYEEKKHIFSSTVESFNSHVESSNFTIAVESIITELNNNKTVLRSGITADTLAVWWESEDNNLFVLKVRAINIYVDSLDNDYLKINQSYSKSQSLNTNFPHNKKALLLSPAYWEFAPKVLSPKEDKKDINYYFKSKLLNNGYSEAMVHYYKHEEFESQNITLEYYSNWTDYGIISFHGHAGAIVNPVGKLAYIDSGIKLTKEFHDQNKETFKYGGDYIWYGDVLDYIQNTIGLTNTFFSNTYPNGLDNTFILMNSCESQKDNILAKSLIQDNINSVFWGWTKVMQPLMGGWARTRFLIDLLIDDGKTMEEAYTIMVQKNRDRHRVMNPLLLVVTPAIAYATSYYTYLEMSDCSNKEMRLIDKSNENGDEGDWPRDTQTEVVEVTNPTTGKIWMDRNLGASRAATSSTDEEAYGRLYQWGRAADGHQIRTSSTTSTRSSSDTPGHGSFITSSSGANWDWRSPKNDNLWQGVNGVNNPCPAGYRLPTEAELNAERQSWSSNDHAGAFASPLKLPLAGLRGSSNGSLSVVGEHGGYWSSNVSSNDSRRLYFSNTDANVVNGNRANGRSVRCIKD